MNPTISAADPERQRNDLPSPSGAAVKVGLRPEVPGTRFRDLAKDSLRQVKSQKVAAKDLELSEGRLSSKLADGTLMLKEIEQWGVPFEQALGETLIKKHGPADPKARARELVREIHQLCAQVLELIA